MTEILGHGQVFWRLDRCGHQRRHAMCTARNRSILLPHYPTLVRSFFLGRSNQPIETHWQQRCLPMANVFKNTCGNYREHLKITMTKDFRVAQYLVLLLLEYSATRQNCAVLHSIGKIVLYWATVTPKKDWLTEKHSNKGKTWTFLSATK